MLWRALVTKLRMQNSGGQLFPLCRLKIFCFPPKGKWEKFLLLCSPTVFFDKLRINSEPKSVVVVLLEFIVVYANCALQAPLTADQ